MGKSTVDLEKTLLPEPTQRRSVNSFISIIFFVFAGFASFWLAWIVLERALQLSWGWLWAFIPFWLLLSYIALPRLHSIMTSIYVPDYFIGRTRTTDGLLGDPVNLAVRGSQDQLLSAMKSSGWVRADEITLRSSWRIITSTLTGKSYPEAPVSTLKLFNRQQDFAFQKEVEGSPAKRHHVRFWRTPKNWWMPGGFTVDWLAAGTYDRSVGFSIFTLQITHKIEANIDEERDYIVNSLQQADPQASVEIIEHYASGYHSRNGGGDQIVTDGAMPIVDLGNYQPSADILAQQVHDTAEVPDTDVEVPAMERPITTIFGATFSVVSGFLFLIAAFALYYLGGVEQLSKDVLGLLALSVPVGLLQIGLGWQVWRGKNWARIIAMALISLSISLTMIATVTGEEQIRFGPSLFMVALDIVVLMALSSQSAQAYSQHTRY